MLLNFVEKAMMNNPVRATIQRQFEARRLLSMGGQMVGGAALEVGCGRGVGTELILDVFGAECVDAFDVDPQMIELARCRLAARGERVHLWTGNVTAIPSADSCYDAVFDFGIIHHVANWRYALREVHRVLKPGGRLYAEEVLERFLTHPIWKRLLEHPKQNRFHYDRFREALVDCGFKLVLTNQLWQCFGWFVVDKPR